MVDYYGNRHNERFTFRRVTWPEQVEAEELPMFIGGSVEKSAFSDLKESGSAEFDATERPDDHDLLRIIYSFDDDYGEHAENVIATMRMAFSAPDLEGECVSGSVDLYGMLQVLSNKKYGMPFTVVKGTAAVDFSKELCEGLGLKVNASPSSYKTNSDHTFEDDASYLTIVNWLLDAASFSSAYTDSYGIIQMQPYVDPTSRDVKFTFRDDDQSIMLPKVSVTNDWVDSPNVVKLYYETESESLWASATNNDPTSKASIASRQVENTLQETVTELSGDTTEERLANLKEAAKKKLIDNSSEIEYVQLDHPWIPLETNDAVGVEYVRAGFDWAGSITDQSIDLSTQALTTMKARRYVRSSLVVEVDGGVLYSAEA